MPEDSARVPSAVGLVNFQSRQATGYRSFFAIRPPLTMASTSLTDCPSLFIGHWPWHGHLQRWHPTLSCTCLGSCGRTIAAPDSGRCGCWC